MVYNIEYDNRWITVIPGNYNLKKRIKNEEEDAHLQPDILCIICKLQKFKIKLVDLFTKNVKAYTTPEEQEIVNGGLCMSCP